MTGSQRRAQTNVRLVAHVLTPTALIPMHLSAQPATLDDLPCGAGWTPVSLAVSSCVHQWCS